jgi:hypothetical protein
LVPADCFVYQDIIFLLTQDYKKDSSRLAISLADGCSRWFAASTIVEYTDLYTMNSDGHLVMVKNNEKDIEKT